MENMMNGYADRQYISSEVRFYTIPDVMKLTGWGEKTVQKLFNDPSFPSSDLGKGHIVEAHALISYFSKRHSKRHERYWNRKGNANVKLSK